MGKRQHGFRLAQLDALISVYFSRLTQGEMAEPNFNLACRISLPPKKPNPTVS